MTKKQPVTVLVVEHGTDGEWTFQAPAHEAGKIDLLIQRAESELAGQHPTTYAADWSRGDELPEVGAALYVDGEMVAGNADIMVGRNYDLTEEEVEDRMLKESAEWAEDVRVREELAEEERRTPTDHCRRLL